MNHCRKTDLQSESPKKKPRPEEKKTLERLDHEALNGKVHGVLKTSILPPYADGFEYAVFGTGCFWGSEKGFWRLPGVNCTAVGEYLNVT